MTTYEKTLKLIEEYKIKDNASSETIARIIYLMFVDEKINKDDFIELMDRIDYSIDDDLACMPENKLREYLKNIHRSTDEIKKDKIEEKEMMYTNLINYYRIKQGLSLEDLAKKVGVSKQTISQVEKSTNNLNNVDLVIKIAKELDKSPVEIYDKNIFIYYPENDNEKIKIIELLIANIDDKRYIKFLYSRIAEVLNDK